MKDTEVNAIYRTVLAGLNLNPKAPARWRPQVYRRPASEAELSFGLPPVLESPDGYTCSRCGKWECYKAKKCPGCGEVMKED